jgi:hypothetical protein
MPSHVRADERTDHDRRKAALANVGEGCGDELRANARSFDCRIDLGVKERDPTRLKAIVDEADDVVAASCLVAVLRGIVGDLYAESVRAARAARRPGLQAFAYLARSCRLK